MRKVCIIVFLISIIILSCVGCGLTQTANAEYLRIHIRANSNAQNEQSIKYAVSNKVVEFLTPIVAECNSKQRAMELLENNLNNIESVANTVLRENGYSYVANAYLCEEKFPTRVYNGFTLESGIYDALIIELGSGKGQNWWCVLYPPLCFTENVAGYHYKSKILEIINDFLNKGKN